MTLFIDNWLLICQRDISRRCHLAWEELPSYLRYTTQCWRDGSPVAVCLMMIISYLAYLYNDFLIQRLIAGKNNPRGNTALLSVSAEILSTVLALGTQREQMVDLSPDFTWTVFTNTFTFIKSSNANFNHRFSYMASPARVY